MSGKGCLYSSTYKNLSNSKFILVMLELSFAHYSDIHNTLMKVVSF